ncbi:MAG: sensor histidine kinase [Micromonospora sp.]
MTPAAGAPNRHHALFYASPQELLAAAVPFLRAGLDGDEAIVLVCSDEINELLADGLAADPRLVIMPPGGFYTTAAGALAGFRELVRQHLTTGAHRVRIIGEVTFGTQPEDWAEWTRFEAVVNVALAEYSLWNVCVYDTTLLPERVLTEVSHTHPYLLDPAPRPNDRHVPPEQMLRSLTTPGPDPIQAGTALLDVADLTSLRQLAVLREQVRLTAAVAGAPEWRQNDLMIAVNEVATNGLRHGRPPVRVRIWAGADRLVCTVTDRGEGFDDPLAGYRPATGDALRHTAGGLWLTRQCCDRVDLTRTADGFTVRLVQSLTDPALPHADGLR